MSRDWLIVYQQRAPFNPEMAKRLERRGFSRTSARKNWRCYRKFSVLPLRFATAGAAQLWLEWMGDATFKNMSGRKLSCSVTKRSALRDALGLV